MLIDQQKAKDKANTKNKPQVSDDTFEDYGKVETNSKATTEYYDPEFDELWDEIEQEHNEIVNSSTIPAQDDELQSSTPNGDFNSNEWEEV